MEQTNLDPQQEQAPVQSTAPAVTQVGRRKFWLVGGLIILLLAVGAVAYWYVANQSQAPTPGGEIVVPTPEADTDPEPLLVPDGTYYVPPVFEGDRTSLKPNTTVTWQTPKQLANLNLVFVTVSDADYQKELNEQIKYFQLGTNGGNKIILVHGQAVDLGGPVLIFFEQRGGEYVYMGQMNDSTQIYSGPESSASYAVTSQVKTADTKTYYEGLVAPGKLSWEGLNLRVSEYRDGLFDLQKQSREKSGYQFKLLAKVSGGELYLLQKEASAEASPEVKFRGDSFAFRTPASMYYSAQIDYKFFGDDMVPNITWDNGTKNTDPFRPDAYLAGGCGYAVGYLSPMRNISGEITKTGVASDGTSIYELVDKHDPILKVFYDLFGGRQFNPSTQQSDPVTFEEWNKHHPVIAIANTFGGYYLMTNESYGVAAECGKPVIYLYPPQETKVTVQVGANVTVSEPEYASGWKVLARPDGSLQTLDGRKFGSLFWEGQGKGVYPEVNTGFVVKHSEAGAVMSQHLKLLGLTEKEAMEFKEFWLPLIPDAPFVRLTWFGTEEMNELAPLYVQPRPDTVIRIFLDMAGLQEPVKLPTPQLQSIPRRGFTVVEWGGLLRK